MAWNLLLLWYRLKTSRLNRVVKITFDQSQANRERLNSVYKSGLFLEADFLTITHGVRELAVKRINIVEIVSTFTELTFILRDREIDLAIAQFARELSRKFQGNRILSIFLVSGKIRPASIKNRKSTWSVGQ